MNKKIVILIISALLCHSIGTLSVVADTESTFILEQSNQIKSSDTPKQSIENKTLPITGKKIGILPMTGEQLHHVLSIIGAILVSLLFIFWKNRSKERSGK